jgi:nitroreductase
MFDLEEAINQRHSTRLFLRDKPVPRPLVDEALKLAVRAPSNSNVQPWHVVFASGPARDRLVKALLREAESKPPRVPPCRSHSPKCATTSAPWSTARWA